MKKRILIVSSIILLIATGVIALGTKEKDESIPVQSQEVEKFEVIIKSIEVDKSQPDQVVITSKIKNYTDKELEHIALEVQKFDNSAKVLERQTFNYNNPDEEVVSRLKATDKDKDYNYNIVIRGYYFK